MKKALILAIAALMMTCCTKTVKYNDGTIDTYKKTKNGYTIKVKNTNNLDDVINVEFEDNCIKDLNMLDDYVMYKNFKSENGLKSKIDFIVHLITHSYEYTKIMAGQKADISTNGTTAYVKIYDKSGEAGEYFFFKYRVYVKNIYGHEDFVRVFVFLDPHSTHTEIDFF